MTPRVGLPAVSLLLLLLLLLLLSALVAAVAATAGASSSPTVADPSDGSHTICAVRELAYQRALAAQPHNAPLTELFDALQLQTLCGKAPPPAPAPEAVRAPTTSAAPSAGELHVDPQSGDDRTGEPAFRTVGAAVTAARRSGIKSLVLHSGIHFLNETLTLTAADSGFSITAASGEDAWLSGGVPLTGLTWTKESNGVHAATISDHSVVDIPGLLTVGKDDHAPTSRLVRARYPNGNWELDLWGAKNASSVASFYTDKDHCTKTGSGQT